MSQKLPVNNFEWIEEASQFNEDFIKNYNEESDEGHFLKVDVNYPQKGRRASQRHTIFIRKKETEKVEKLVTNLHDKNDYVVHIRNLKQALNHGSILKKVHRAIQFKNTN